MSKTHIRDHATEVLFRPPLPRIQREGRTSQILGKGKKKVIYRAKASPRSRSDQCHGVYIQLYVRTIDHKGEDFTLALDVHSSNSLSDFSSCSCRVRKEKEKGCDFSLILFYFCF